jgi:hypothetical protein
MTCDTRTPNQFASGDIINSIKCEIPDNNTAKISAANVRENMEDIVFSINRIVCSGDTQDEFPFFNAVKASIVDGGSGIFIPESGILFPYSPVTDERELLQTRPWLGPGGINHDELSDRSTSNNAHTQYLSIDGTRPMSDNLPMGANWINASGAYDGDLEPKNDRGIKFQYAGDHDDVLIGTSGALKFNKDNTQVTSFAGVARAWLQFQGSGTAVIGEEGPIIESYHNIESLHKIDEGKYKITFKEGTFQNNNYAAFGQSNARSTLSDAVDFDRNTVGLVERTGDDNPTLRSITFVCLNEQGQYVDGESCSFMAFGYGPNEESGVPPTVT